MKKLKKLSLNREKLRYILGGITSPRDPASGQSTGDTKTANTCNHCPSQGISYCGPCN